MRPLHENLAGRLLLKLAEALQRRPRWFLYPQLGLALACIVLTITRLEFSTNRTDLASANEKYQRDFLEFSREFQLHDSLVAIAESDSPERNRQFVERLARKMRGEPQLFTDIYFKGDLQQMGSKALLFLPEDTLDEIRGALQTNRPLIEAFSKVNNLNALFQAVNRQLRSAAESTPSNLNNDSRVRPLPTLERLVELATESIVQPAGLPAPGISAFFGDGPASDDHGLYLTFARGRMYLVTAQPASDEVEAAAIRKLRKLVSEAQNEVTGINAGITGEAVLKYDEMIQARHDTDLAAVISLVLSALIFIYGYNEIRRPLMATFCLLIGIAYTLGFATLAVGQLNILSISLVPILIGLAMDFAVHLIARYEEELRRGNPQHAAMRKSLAFTGIGIFSSGFTTAGAFFAMMFTDIKGVRDMGLISGVGLLVCLIPMMTLLPLLLVKGRADLPEGDTLDRKPTRRERFEQSYLKRPRLVLACGAALTVFALTQFHKVHFDYNLLNLQTRDLPAVGIERKLIESGSESLLYGVVIADSLPQAVEMDRRIRQLPSVAKVVSMAGYLNEDPQRKLALVSAIKTQVAAIQLLNPDTSPVDLANLGQTLFSLQGYLGLGADIIKQGGGNPTLEGQLRSLREAVGGLQRMLAAGHPQTATRLTAFQQELFADLRQTIVTIRDQDTREGLKIGDVPPFLRHRFISRGGKFMLQVYSKDDLWQRDKQERFVRELRTVAPNVTGSPVQFYEYTSMLKDSFQKAAGYAGAVIAFLVYLHFRRISSVLLAFLPVALGVCWMLGLMGFFGLPFNPVNIIALTLVIGIGVTNGIHILNRFAEESHPSLLARSTGKAVLVSALTTMAGFGSLMVAKHQGIASLGKVMLMGTGMCMVASLAFLPAVLNLLNGIGWTMIKQHKTLRELLRRRKAVCAATEVPRG